MQICLQVQKLLINQSVYCSVPFWEIGLRKFVSHTTVLQQLQFKMPETVVKHYIWPLKVVFLNRIIPEAPNFEENWKSIFLTSRSKIVTFCIVTEYQCDSFRAVGSHIDLSPLLCLVGVYVSMHPCVAFCFHLGLFSVCSLSWWQLPPCAHWRMQFCPGG